MPSTSASSRITFGLYEVDIHAGELWRGGYRVKLQSQPFKVLQVLLEHAGEVVTREELQTRLWGTDTIVDFDHSIATAVNKIREALRDSAENPRFVETLARRGYRFIAPVSHSPESDEALNSPAAIPSSSAEESRPARLLPASDALAPPPAHVSSLPLLAPGSFPTPPHTQDGVMPVVPEPRVEALPSARSSTAPPPWLILTLVLAAAAAWGGYSLGELRQKIVPPAIEQLTQDGHLAVGPGVTDAFSAGATDGYRLFLPTVDRGRAAIETIPASGGPPTELSIPDEVASPTLGDISPDGSHLLLRNHLSPESEQPLWIVPTSGSSALRVGAVLAHDATWMPAGRDILFASGNDLYLTRENDSSPKLFARLPGRGFWMRWNADGTLLRLTILDPTAHTQSLWEIAGSDRIPHRLLDGFTDPAAECCGVWTRDDAYIFQASHGGPVDLWKLAPDATRDPVRLTNGPLQFESPVVSRDGSSLFFLGVDTRSRLERLSPRGELIPEHGFLASASRVEFSRDRRWVLWTDNLGKLWRASADGTQKLQLTPDGWDVFLAHWSPDNARLAIMARKPGSAWKLYLVSANGGDIQPLLQDSRNAADPSWSQDGRSLVFGRTNDMLGSDTATRLLQVLDLATGQVTVVPGSEGLFSPRWSPDGHYIAALSVDQRRVRLFDLRQRTWSTLAVGSGADPVWSADSRSLFLHQSLDPNQPIDRIDIPSGGVHELIRLASSTESDAVDYVFVGLTSDDAPLVRARTVTGNLYRMGMH